MPLKEFVQVHLVAAPHDVPGRVDHGDVEALDQAFEAVFRAYHPYTTSIPEQDLMVLFACLQMIT